MAQLPIYEDLKILVLEDDPQAQELVKRCLKEIGFLEENLTIAMHGGEGKKHIEQAGSPFELIIVDMVMPEVSGLQFLTWLRGQNQYQAVPKITLSSQEEQSIILEAIKLGTHNYIVKPVSSTVLAKKIINAFETVEKQKK